MKFEIERKFLVNHHSWEQLEKPSGDYLRQGYILNDPNKTVRVRLTGSDAFLTIKGISTGFSRPEFEYSIPQADAEQLLDNFCDSELSKTRYKIDHEGKIWEVDVFHGHNTGLILAEIELDHEDESFEIPHWVAEEVTGDVKYYNSNLSK